MIQFLFEKVLGLLGKVMLDEAYVYVGKSDELESKIFALKTPKVKKIGHKQYKLKPSYSFGTLIVKGSPGAVEGINVIATLKELDESKQLIQFTTDIRVEHFMMVLVFPIMMIGFGYTGESKWTILMIFGIWVVCHLWFQWVYRVQEKSVVNKAVKNLGLSKRLTKTS